MAAPATFFLVVVWLTFTDGSVVAWNDQKWEHAPDFKTCTEMLGKDVEAMRVKYKDYEGSTFITQCIRKGKGVKDA